MAPDDPTRTETTPPSSGETLDGLPVLPDAPRVLLQRPDPAPLDDDNAEPETAIRPATPMIDALSSEAVAELRREGSWRVGGRLLLGLVIVVFTFRLAFDEALPRLLLVLMLTLAGLALVHFVLRGVAEAGRQRAMLQSLEQLMAYARERPEAAVRVEPQIAALLAALRKPTASLPWSSSAVTVALPHERE